MDDNTAWLKACLHLVEGSKYMSEFTHDSDQIHSLKPRSEVVQAANDHML